MFPSHRYPAVRPPLDNQVFLKGVIDLTNTAGTELNPVLYFRYVVSNPYLTLDHINVYLRQDVSSNRNLNSGIAIKIAHNGEEYTIFYLSSIDTQLAQFDGASVFGVGRVCRTVPLNLTINYGNEIRVYWFNINNTGGYVEYTIHGQGIAQDFNSANVGVATASQEQDLRLLDEIG